MGAADADAGSRAEDEETTVDTEEAGAAREKDCKKEEEGLNK